MKGKVFKEENYVSVSHLGDLAGTILHYGLHSLDSFSHDTCIIDKSASNHMCANLNLITNSKVQKSFRPVHLLDGSSQMVKHSGNVI